MRIRKLCTDDAEAYLELLRQLDQETPFMLYESGERTTTVDEQRKRLELIEKAEHEVIFVAEEAGELVGFIAGFAGALARNRYCAYIVIGVLKDYARKGIGTQLFAELEEWAKERRIRRLELTVMEHNRPAMLLYAKCGFHVEGMRKQSLYVGGQFVNEFYMAKFLDLPDPAQ